MSSVPLTMKPFDYYDVTKLQQPDVRDYMTTYFYDNGELVATVPPGTSLEMILNDTSIKIPTTAVKQQVINKESYERAMQNYKEEMSRLNKEFGNDLFREFNIEDHPKRNRCYALAYKLGYQFGPAGIYDYFEKLVPLIKD